MDSKPTMSNTKKEILAAYDALLKKKTQETVNNPKDEKIEKQKKEVVTSASAMSAETIVKGLGDMKLQISQSIDSIEDSLLREFQQLEKLQQAIRYESEYLEELYGIKASADSLAVLLAINKEKKVAFDLEMDQKKSEFEHLMLEKKQDWEREKKDRLNQWNEENAERKKEISREEEAYEYNKNLTRKKEIDAYQYKKEVQEKELLEQKTTAEKDWEEREKVIATRELELDALNKQVSEFPDKLTNAVADAQKELQTQLATQHSYEMELYAKEMEGEIKLLQQTISSMDKKIKEQDNLIISLNEKSNVAGNQVQTIAMKALDSAASLRFSSVTSKEKREEKANE